MVGAIRYVARNPHLVCLGGNLATARSSIEGRNRMLLTGNPKSISTSLGDASATTQGNTVSRGENWDVPRSRDSTRSDLHVIHFRPVGSLLTYSD